MGLNGTDWIDLAVERVQWRAVVVTLMNRETVEQLQMWRLVKGPAPCVG
jgi:hypothetical protein